ncbi:MAG: hypothetical protein ACRC8S_04925 [Fimbriiglobus sp.]
MKLGEPVPGLWWGAFLLVLMGQAGMALHLFSGYAPLTDDQPILSGRHPLHLYHGILGAETFLDRSTTSCYDPAYQAGYPKTPVFDGSSRPAELMILLFPDIPAATAYKIGVFALCLLAPIAFGAGAWGIGFDPAARLVASVAGALLWWSEPVQAMLSAGAVDLLLAGLAAIPALGALNRYTHRPGPGIWCLLTVLSCIGWFAHPLIWIGFLPIGLGHYFLVAPKQELAWHLGRLGIVVFGLLPNLWWLQHWAKFWWIRSPSIDDFACWPCVPTALTSWSQYPSLFGSGYLGWGLVIVGVMGLVSMFRQQHKLAATLILVGAVVAIVVARIAQAAPILQQLHAERAAIMAVGWLTLPAAYFLTRKSDLPGILVCVPLILAIVNFASPKPLVMGYTDHDMELIHAIQQHTTPDARILWEDIDPKQSTWNISALLAMRTERSFLGGLDFAAHVEHNYCSLRNGRLNDRIFEEWSRTDLEDFVTRYNVGWVIARSPVTIHWWSQQANCRELTRLRDANSNSTIVLFRLDRKPSFILSGQAKLERADRSKIVLTDVIPNADGEVILSFHHQPGFRIAPSYVVQTEGTKDLHDPIPLLRLRLPGPMSRITIAWDNP